MAWVVHLCRRTSVAAALHLAAKPTVTAITCLLPQLSASQAELSSEVSLSGGTSLSTLPTVLTSDFDTP